MLKYPAEHERDISSAKFTAISRQVSPDSLLGVCACIFQKALVDASGMIRTQRETHNRSGNGRSAWGAVYDTIPTVKQ
jgi:hypothetical protein